MGHHILAENRITIQNNLYLVMKKYPGEAGKRSPDDEELFMMNESPHNGCTLGFSVNTDNLLNNFELSRLLNLKLRLSGNRANDK